MQLPMTESLPLTAVLLAVGLVRDCVKPPATRSPHLFASNLEGQCASLCICEHHLQAFVELGALEEGLKVPQGFQFSILKAASTVIVHALSKTSEWHAQVHKAMRASGLITVD